MTLQHDKKMNLANMKCPAKLYTRWRFLILFACSFKNILHCICKLLKAARPRSRSYNLELMLVEVIGSI